MTKTVLLAAAAVLALTAGASAGPAPVVTGVKSAPAIWHMPKGSTTLYNQNSNNSGVGLVSQNFSTTYSKTYDATGADDFIVPKKGLKDKKKKKKGWTVTEVDVTGVYFNGSGPAASETVTFYADSSGVPGAPLKGGVFTVTGTDSSGTFSITLPKKGMFLKAGHYWVGVAANLDFSTGGEWGWEGNTSIKNYDAMWENPGGGFGTSCTSWGTNGTCLGYTQDDMFDLKGTAG